MDFFFSNLKLCKHCLKISVVLCTAGGGLGSDGEEKDADDLELHLTPDEVRLQFKATDL